MMHAAFIALLDANVLYPAPVRDFLLHLGALELYQPKWTNKIHAEWTENLLANRPDIKRKSLESAKLAMNMAFPNANVTEYEKLINSLTLPDKDDRHVLAAAITGKANIIVTSNKKDFPKAYLKSYNLEALTPDEFVVYLLSIDKVTVKKALTNQVEMLKNPPKSKQEVLETLKNAGLIQAVQLIRNIVVEPSR